MKTPKKPAARSVRIQSVTFDAPSPALTPAELALLAAYRAMDDETKIDAEDMLKILARNFPRGPRLRLVSAGPK